LVNGIAPLDAIPGGAGHQWWAYHGNDGGIFWNSDYNQIAYEQYGEGDVVGCGVNSKKQIFFTKNGVKQGLFPPGSVLRSVC
jgi:hypothetical protein